MKKLLFIMMLGILWSSCSDPNDLPLVSSLEDPKETFENPFIISPEEATQKANEAYLFYTGVAPAQSSRAATSEVYAIGNKSSRSVASDTIAYIVNFPDNGGYSVIAASRRISSACLAFVPNGHLTSLDEIEVEPQRLFLATTLDNLKDDIEIEKPMSRYEITPMPIETIKADTTKMISGFVSGLEWTQSDVFGKYCDNNLCGCFPLAVGLIMARLEQPTTMDINFENDIQDSVKKTITLNWSDIKKLKNPYSFIFGEARPSAESKDNIGLMLRQVGKLCGTKYWADKGSSTTSGDGKSGVKKIFPKKSVSGYDDYKDPDQIYNGLKDNGNVLMIGAVAGEDVGHAWIAEEYIYKYIKVDHYFDGVYSYTTTQTSKSAFLNWGWAGSGNGYYECKFSTSFTPTNTSSKYEDIKLLVIK